MRTKSLILTLLLVSARCLWAQSADYGGIGDPATAPGDPRSSHALSGIDHVNYYSGSVNFTIPLTVVGGRGSVARPLVIPIQRQWSVFSTEGSGYSPSTGTGNYMGGFYSGGDITMVTFGKQPNACYSSSNGYQDLGPYTTYIVWESYDRTRTILTDAATNGQPQGAAATCAQVQAGQTPNRGHVFRSTDGSNLLFIAGHDIIDGNYSNVNDGTLIFPDGTKYRFGPSDIYVSSIEDRNGNLIKYAFQGTDNGGIYNITDPLNRVSTIDFTESLATDAQDVITVPGFSGSHQITVNYALLANALASGESLQTYQSLFPELNGSSSTQFNPYVIASVGLPDGTAYGLQYNSYGEVTRLQLPTGGVYTYRYLEANGAANGNSGVLALANNSGHRIYRRLQERDEYADGAHLSAKAVFPAPAGNAANGDPNHPNRPTVNVEADFEDAAGNLLRKEAHYFYGNPGSTQPPPTDPTQYAGWWQGIEFRTEVSDNNGAFQRQEQIWAQRPCGSGESCVADPQSEGSPAHDPRVCQSNRVLENGGNASTVLGYDDQHPYNNLSDKYEYDYGAGPVVAPTCSADPSNWLRHTIMTYRGDSAYLSPNVHLVSLPYETKVVDGSTGQQIAYTLRNYDELDQNHKLDDAPGILNHDGTVYGVSNNIRGDLTTVWQSRSGS